RSWLVLSPDAGLSDPSGPGPAVPAPALSAQASGTVFMSRLPLGVTLSGGGGRGHDALNGCQEVGRAPAVSAPRVVESLGLKVPGAGVIGGSHGRVIVEQCREEVAPLVPRCGHAQILAARPVTAAVPGAAHRRGADRLVVGHAVKVTPGRLRQEPRRALRRAELHLNPAPARA